MKPMTLFALGLVLGSVTGMGLVPSTESPSLEGSQIRGPAAGEFTTPGTSGPGDTRSPHPDPQLSKPQVPASPIVGIQDSERPAKTARARTKITPSTQQTRDEDEHTNRVLIKQSHHTR